MAPNNPGLANSSPWNSSPFAFAPNTNTMDPESMPSEQAALARAKTQEIMAALKAGDTNKANALLGKDETGGKFLPGIGRLKRKVNGRKNVALEGVAIEEEKSSTLKEKEKKKLW